MANGPTTITKLAIEWASKLAATVSSLQLPGYRFKQMMVTTGPNASARLGVNVDIMPLEAAFTLAQSDALTDWALSLPRGKSAQPLNGAALVLDINGKLTRRVEWTQALVTELRLPELDASTVTCATASGKIITLPPSSKTKKTPVLSNFRGLGLPFNGLFISRVTLPTVTGTPSAQKPGYAQVDSGEVKLMLSARSRVEALAWVQQVVADGQIAGEEYLSLDIELLDAALKDVLVTVQLSGCALLGYEASQLDPTQEALATVTPRFAVGKLDMFFAGV